MVLTFIPIEVSEERSQVLGLRWLTQYARLRGGRGMAEKLANEIIDASNGTGAQLKNVKILTEWQKLIRHLLI